MLRSLILCVVAILLSSQPSNATRVINAGVPGQNTAEIDERTERELTTHAPDLVVIFAGMNDAVNDKKFLSPEQSRLHLESIIRKCRLRGAQVLLITLHQPDIVRLMQRHRPEAYGDRSPQRRIRDMNAVIHAIAANERVPVVDFAQILEEKGGATTEWSTDGVHLTAKGYALLAKTVSEQLRQLGGDVQNVLCLGDSLTFGIGVREPNAPGQKDTYPDALESYVR